MTKFGFSTLPPFSFFFWLHVGLVAGPPSLFFFFIIGVGADGVFVDAAGMIACMKIFGYLVRENLEF